MEILPATTPETPVEQVLHRRSEHHVLDKLCAPNEVRGGVRFGVLLRRHWCPVVMYQTAR